MGINSLLSLVDSEDQTQVFSLGGNLPYSRSYLAGPREDVLIH